jgi:hypothetical protein
MPSIIQLAHTLENHKHVVCISKEVKHVHEKELDCSQLHRQFQTFSIDFPSNYDVIPQHFYTSVTTTYLQLIIEDVISKKNPRGPPYFIV